MTSERSRASELDASSPAASSAHIEAMMALNAKLAKREELVREIDKIFRLTDGTARDSVDEESLLDRATALSADLALLLTNLTAQGMWLSRSFDSYCNYASAPTVT